MHTHIHTHVHIHTHAHIHTHIHDHAQTTRSRATWTEGGVDAAGPRAAVAAMGRTAARPRNRSRMPPGARGSGAYTYIHTLTHTHMHPAWECFSSLFLIFFSFFIFSIFSCFISCLMYGWFSMWGRACSVIFGRASANDVPEEVMYKCQGHRNIQEVVATLHYLLRNQDISYQTKAGGSFKCKHQYFAKENGKSKKSLKFTIG